VTVTELNPELLIIRNVTQLTEERQLNDEAIARYSDTPALIAGLERIQVKAAGGQVLFAWTQSTLLKIREVLRIYLQRAWYLRNLKAVILRRLKRLGFTKIDEETGKPIIDKSALASQLEQSRTGEDSSTRTEDLHTLGRRKTDRKRYFDQKEPKWSPNRRKWRQIIRYFTIKR
jgi:hypothetical protein